MTLIQRFGSALNLNIHFHMLFLDGVYLTGTKRPVFRRIAPPSTPELQALVHRIAERIGQALERRGLLTRDCETSYLTLDPADDSAMNDLLGHSITYRVAVGPRAGAKVFTLQTVPPVAEGEPEKRVAQDSGFSLHAGVAAEGGERNKLEHLCRYVTQHVALTWMQRLKRVFAIDIETCARCGGKLKVIASIEDPAVIGRILKHLEGGESAPSPFAPRAPPQRELPV